MPFLAARPHPHPSAVIIGAPYDATASHRAGASLAPAAIRWASDSIETYSPVQERDLEDLRLADAGDLDLAGCTPEVMIDRVRAAVAGVSSLPVVVGGEHTVTLGAILALADRHRDLGVVVLDAHLDLRDAYQGQRWSHAATLRRMSERLGPERIVVLGARSGTREEWARAATLAAVSRAGTLEASVWAALSGRPLYLSVDIDAFDPSVAPGTGNPEPVGLQVDDVMPLLAVVREGRVVGCDLVEVSPPYDPSGQTAVLAAWLIREMVLAFARA
ncbi:MAG: agmatinase [Armatimonadetes bacterium]|nr:agmatinase [Armatimonadota bacterium]